MGMRWSSLLGMAPPVLALVLLLGGGAAVAAPNKCGCTRNESNNTCSCAKGAKCGCPGDCEPKGCEEKREQQMKREIEAETKKAEASQHRKAGGQGQGEDDSSARDQAPSPKKAASHRLSAAQGKQLAKLIDLYLSDHPDARGSSIEEVRNAVAGH